jgi:hypothetical protein
MQNLGPYLVEKDELLEAIKGMESKPARKLLDKRLKKKIISVERYNSLLEKRFGIDEESHGTTVPVDVAKEIGSKLKVDFDKVNFEEFRKGISVELEHSDTVGGGFEIAAKIALDHLKEMPNYYTELVKMEKG